MPPANQPLRIGIAEINKTSLIEQHVVLSQFLFPAHEEHHSYINEIQLRCLSNGFSIALNKDISSKLICSRVSPALKIVSWRFPSGWCIDQNPEKIYES